MKCPRCGKEINKVEIIVQTRLVGKLRGNRIVEQEPLGDVDDSREIKCPECNQEITRFIRR